VATLFAQTHNSANKLFQDEDYLGAQLAYAALLKSYPNNPLYLYRYARCAQEQGDFSTALHYFDKAGDRYMLKYFYMGDIYMQLWQAEEAIKAYTTYLNSLKEPNEREAYIQQQINYANKLRRYLRRVEKLQVIDSVEVALDSMLSACALSAEAGNLTLDSNYSVIYTNQRGDRRLQAVTDDSAQVLISAHHLLEDWTSADTLPKNINFTIQQSSPFLLNDGVTLYFAANDTNGLGGLDIYISRYNMTTETYTTPENIGMPYNSPANEYMLLLDEVRSIGYLATDRFAKKGNVHVYSFIIPEQKQYHEISDSLALFARLECFDLVDSIINNSNNTLKITQENTDESEDFCLIINDSIVYHSLADFRDHNAKEMFTKWQKAELQYHTEQEKLAQLREQYATAEQEKKKELTPVILQLENNQSQLINQCESLLQEIRAAEIRVR